MYCLGQLAVPQGVPGEPGIALLGDPVNNLHHAMRAGSIRALPVWQRHRSSFRVWPPPRGTGWPWQ
jgi:hypothetical protein